MITSLIRRYAEAVVRYRWIVLIVMLFLTVALGSRITMLKLDNDLDLWSPQNNEFIKTTHVLERLFGGRNFTVIGIVPKHGDIYSPNVLNKIRSIQNAVEALPGAVKNNVVSLAAKRVKDIQGNADGMAVHEMLEHIPETPAEMDALRRAIERNPIYVNALVSPDGKAAAVIADFHMPGNATYAPLYEKLNKIADRERDADVDILIGGQPVESANFEFAMKKMPIYFGIAFLIIMAVQLLAFRSVQGMLLPMATAILSVVWGLGALALAGIHMDALNTTTPILIMALATGHAVQILKRYYEELDEVISQGLYIGLDGHGDLHRAKHLAVVRSLVSIGPVMLTAGLIAAIVFFSMQVSELMIIRNFGFFAGAGVIAMLIIEFTFTPALRAILPVKTRKPRRPDAVDTLLGWVGDILIRPGASRTILISAAALIAIVGVGSSRLYVDNSFKQYSASDSPIRKDDAILNAKFGGTDTIFFLIQGSTPDSMKDPKVLAAMAKLQAFLEQQKYVGKTQSLADLIRRMNQAMHGDDKTYDVVPTNANLVSQYLLLYSMSGQPQDFDNLVDNDYQNAVIWTYLKTDSTAYAESLWKSSEQLIKREFPKNVTVRIGGGLPQTMAINNSLVDNKMHSILQMAAVVFMLSSLAFSSFIGGFLVVAPLATIVLTIFGLMGWMGIPLDMGTATITAMVVGVGADYEIYMLYRLREEFARHGDLDRALRTSLLTSGRAVLFVALSIAGGYSALLISDFKFYPRLGGTMMAAMLISALLSLLLLRAVIVMLKPKFIVGSGAMVPEIGSKLSMDER